MTFGPRAAAPMTRCKIVVLVGLAMLFAAALPAAAQLSAAGKPVRIGILSITDNERNGEFEAFRLTLRKLGYIEGNNIILDWRFARGDYAGMPKLAAELVSIPVDIIVTAGSEGAARAAVAATKTIPIVMATSSDPVAAGLVQSLARPGGNITGFTLVPSGINAKRLDLLRLALPDISAVAVLLNPANPSSEARWRETVEAAKALGLAATQIAAANVDAL